MTAIRFGKRLKVPSTLQIKHRFLLWWLRHQAAKEVAEVSAEESIKNAPMHKMRFRAMHVHEAI